MSYAKKVDAAQAEIVGALRDIGATWIPTSGDPMIGFDGIAIFRGVVRIVEIKNASDPPSKQELTKREQQRKWEVERAGGVYHVWKSAEQVWDALGVVE